MNKIKFNINELNIIGSLCSASVKYDKNPHWQQKLKDIIEKINKHLDN